MKPTIPFVVKFGCDKDKNVEKFVKGNFAVETWYGDVLEEGFPKAGHVDVFDFGAPCQPWSRSNTSSTGGKGAADPRAWVVDPIKKYIANNFPKYWVMEQVAS